MVLHLICTLSIAAHTGWSSPTTAGCLRVLVSQAKAQASAVTQRVDWSLLCDLHSAWSANDEYHSHGPPLPNIKKQLRRTLRKTIARVAKWARPTLRSALVEFLNEIYFANWHAAVAQNHCPPNSWLEH